MVAVGRDGAGETVNGAFFEAVKQIGLIEPDKSDLAAAIFESGDLEVFVIFGVNIFYKSKTTVDSHILILFYLGNGNKVAEIDVSSGEMV